MRTTRVDLVAPHQTPDPDVSVTRLDGFGPAAVSVHEWGRSLRMFGRHLDPDGLRDWLRPAAARQGWDASVVAGPLAERPPALLVMDVDSTLITGEVIDLLADVAGAGERVAEITERAMRGELDFAEALADRVSTLAGLPFSTLAEVAGRVELTPGARELVAAARAAGAKVGLVSGGFIEVVRPLADSIGADFAVANRLEAADSQLTGRTRGEIIDKHAKLRHFLEFADRTGASADACAAIGDGANDIAMLTAAGLGIAYRAKPAAVRAADAAIRFPRLDAARAFALL